MPTAQHDLSSDVAVARADIVSTGLLPDRPPIAALFLIEFDVKAGYTIAWKQAAKGLDLSGAVEYKSLPSGLHAVSEDLIYFVHEDASPSSSSGAGPSTAPNSAARGYAGLSAFVNLPTNEAGARFARMIAVGVLVPRSYGRLGRAWRHAEALMDMAKKIAADRNEIPILEAYWLENSGFLSSASDANDAGQPLLQIDDSPSDLAARPAAPQPAFGDRSQHTRKRSASDGTALLLPSGHRLSLHHPAWSLTRLLETFGPLIFPIYRAALLRKRILISTHAPVREVNNFVYNISVLANIPISVFDILEPSAMPQQRIRPLFTIGVNDIPFLVEDHAASKRALHSADCESRGWIACTTDSILAMKGELWDLLITMPPPNSAQAKDKVWPTVEMPKGVTVKATQRDLRRFRALTTGLERLASRSTFAGANGDTASTSAAYRPTSSSVSRDTGRRKLFQEDDAQLAEEADSIVEPVTWAALAYNGFMWWASAGEQRRADETEESIHDAALLADLVPNTPSLHRRYHRPSGSSNVPYSSQDAANAGVSTSSALFDPVSSLTARRVPAGIDTVAREVEEAGREAADGADKLLEEEGEEERARIELAIIAYFHRLTTQILSVLADIVESSDDDDYENEEYYYDNNSEDGLDGEDGNSNEAEQDDGLLGARRSGLVAGSSANNGGNNPSNVSNTNNTSSVTALLLRRRRGGNGSGNVNNNNNNNTNNNNNSRRQDVASSFGTATGRYANTIRVNSDAVSLMGLDVWSRADVAFVQDLAVQYFGCLGVQVEGKGVEVCGLKVC